MKHPIYKIIRVNQTGDYTLQLEFNDGERKKINFEPVLYGEVYGALRDHKIFATVKIDSEINTIVWDNGADFDPLILHDWEKYIEELTLRAKNWEQVHS